MLKTRPKADARRRLGPVAYDAADALHDLDMAGAALDIGEQRGVIARADAPEMGLQRRCEALTLRLQRRLVARIGEQFDPVAFEEGARLGQRPSLLVGLGQVAGLDLGRFDIRLIEGVDADDRAGDCGGHFPPEKLLPELHHVGHGDPHHRVSRSFQRGNRPLLLGIPVGGEPEIGKNAITAVDSRRAQRLGVERHDAFAELAGGFGEKLFEPGAEIGDAGRRNNRHLVAPAPLGGPEDRTEDHARVLDGRRARGAGPHHLGRTFKEGTRVDADRGRRHHAEIRQHRIAAADARQSVEDRAEPFVARRLFERRAWVGDSDEPLRRFGRADRLLGALVEILLEDVGFERAAGFARHQEQRPPDVDAGFEVPDLRRVSRVQHMQLGVGRLAAEGLGENLWAEARATHAQQQHILEAGTLYVVGEVLEMPDPLQLLVDDIEPTEPVGFVRLCPQRGVRGPKPPDLAFLTPVLERTLDVFLQCVGQLVAHRIELGPEHGAALFLHRRVELVGGIGEQPDPVFDELRGHRLD